MELQELLDKANKDLSASRERTNTLNTRVAELESELGNVRKELLKSEEFSTKHQRDIREVGVSHIPKHTHGVCLSKYPTLALMIVIEGMLKVTFTMIPRHVTIHKHIFLFVRVKLVLYI